MFSIYLMPLYLEIYFLANLNNLSMRLNFPDSEISIDHVKRGYVVWSPSCRIPNIDPYHESIRKFVKNWNPYICSKQKSLTKVKLILIEE